MPRREGSGRKKLDDPKSNKVSMRLSSEELLQFEAYAEKHNLSKANVLRKAVKELFERLLKIGVTQHYAIVDGDWRAELADFAEIMGFEFYDIR